MLDEKYHYTVKYPLANCYGMLLYSRLKLIAPQIKFLVEDDIPSIHAGSIKSGDRIALHCLHPSPSTGPRPGFRRTGCGTAHCGRTVKESDEPALVAGDLNDVAWSRSTKLFQKISGLFDPRIGAECTTRSTRRILCSGGRLDHVFHSNHFKLISSAAPFVRL